MRYRVVLAVTVEADNPSQAVRKATSIPPRIDTALIEVLAEDGEVVTPVERKRPFGGGGGIAAGAAKVHGRPMPGVERKPSRTDIRREAPRR